MSHLRGMQVGGTMCYTKTWWRTEQLDRQLQSATFNFSYFVRFGHFRDQARWVRELASPKKITRPSRKCLGHDGRMNCRAFRSLLIPCAYERHETAMNPGRATWPPTLPVRRFSRWAADTVLGRVYNGVYVCLCVCRNWCNWWGICRWGICHGMSFKTPHITINLFMHTCSGFGKGEGSQIAKLV